MRALVGVCAMCAVAVACGNSSSDDRGSSSGFSSGGPSSSSSSTGGPEDGGDTCEFDPPRSGSAATTAAGAADGGAGWTSTEKVIALDKQTAEVVLDGVERSQEIRVTGFGFTVPSTARVKTVQIELTRQAVGEVYDGEIGLIGVDGQTSTTRHFEPPWPKSAMGVHVYGMNPDTWGMTLAGADVNKASFGVSFWVRRGPTTPQATAKIDAIRVQLRWCPVP